MPPFMQIRPEGVVLSLKVQPRASKNAIGNELKVKVTAPPVDSAANEALIEFLAEIIGCPRNAIRILRGQTSRHKQVLITGIPQETVMQRLVG